MVVEYDAGGCSRARARAKGEAFARGSVGQIWEAPVPERMAYLKALLPRVRVLEAPWA
jgi:hypothetical protein